MFAHQFVLRQIDHAAVKSLGKAIRAAAKKGAILELMIDCKGGSIDEGFKIIELIEDSPVRIEGRVTKEAGSMAAVILQVCHYRVMDTEATLHYHYGSWRVSFLIYFDEKMMQANKEKAIALQGQLVSKMTKKSGITEEEAHDLLRQDKLMTAVDALERNLIDEIRVVEFKVAS